MSFRSDSPWPKLDASLNRVALGDWPTPVEPLRGIKDRDGREMWIKREDRSSRLYGGNKVRKLEYLLGGSTSPVVTVGASGSHHVLATAVHARALGRPCVGILVSQPMTPHVEETLSLVEEVCAAVVRIDEPLRSASQLARAFKRIPAGILGGRVPTIIPPGGSTPAGTLGYVLAGLELADQVSAGECPHPDEIYVALGTGGTAVGLALGLAIAGLDTRVKAVRVASRLSGNRTFLELLAHRTFSLLKKNNGEKARPRLRMQLVHDFIGQGYGHVTDEGQAAVSALVGAGISLETTYTGKAMAAMLASARSDPGITRMFLDTYGPIDDFDWPREVRET